MLAGLGHALAIDRGVRLDYDDQVVEHLLDSGGFEPSLGARPMRRAIARLVEAPLADAILRGEIATGDCAILDVSRGEIGVRVVSDGADASAAE